MELTKMQIKIKDLIENKLGVKNVVLLEITPLYNEKLL